MSGFVFLILFGNFVLGFFGAGFAEGYAGMIAQVIRAAAGPAIQILTILGNQRASIPVYIASIALLFVCDIVFVPIFGFIGAAAAVILTTLFWMVWFNRIVRQKSVFPSPFLPGGSFSDIISFLFAVAKTFSII